MTASTAVPLRALSFLAVAACATQRPTVAPPDSPPETASPVALEAPQPTPSSPEPAADAPRPEDASVSGFELVELPVSGFLPAVVAVPRGDQRLPVVIATHGAGGEPEWTCNEWGERVRGSAIVLCPRGKAISLRQPSGFYYPEHITLEKEVLASVAALERELGARVRPGPMLYTGYSQGATMGALFLIAHGERFPGLVLTEGGFANWTRAGAKRFREGGGKRVLFVCGGAGCRDRAQKSAAVLGDAGVEARVEYVEGGGHTDAGIVGRRLDETYSWARGN